MNLASLLDLPALIVPDSMALVDLSGAGSAREVTYGELRVRAARAANLLRGLGVEPGDRVGLFATNRSEYLEVLFGAAAIGAIAVPMNFRAADEEVAHLLADSAAKVVFSESRYETLLETNRSPALEHLILFDGDYSAARDGVEEYLDADDVGAHQLAILLYTSGTTSHPKGVELSHMSITDYVMGTHDAADGSDNGRMLLAAPLYHVAGLTSMLNALFSGRITIVMSQFDAESWLESVATHRATHAFLVPTMLAHILSADAFATTDLSSMGSITYGAAPMPPSVIRAAIDRFPPSVDFSGAYGQTETTSTVAVLGPDDHRLVGSDAEIAFKVARLQSVGRVLDDVRIRVVDGIGGELDADEVGEIQLMTERVMEGYWGAHEKTRVTIDSAGWVHTGDLGYLDADGYLFLSGRAGDMIIRGGENVAPEEIEAVIHEHEAVIDVAVVGLEDDEWGERVVAAVVLVDGVDVAALEAHCHAHLAPSKRPSAWHVMTDLPRTSTGKIIRRKLIPYLEELGV
jgi:acyl-CoA synthetase (AMP-forming)/AMP-acid ligase II